MPRGLLMCAALLATVALLSSCSSDSGGPGPGDTTPPTITQRSIADGATDIGLIERIEITFSEAMDPATINDTTFVVGGRAPRGLVEYDPDSHTAFYTPDTLYATETWHNLVIADDVADEAGNTLGEPDTTSFETGILDCEHLADCFEPNGSAPEGAAVETDHWYRTLCVCGDDDDYYQFSLDDTATVTIKTLIKHADEGEDWGMHFLRANGDQYATLGTGAYQGGEIQFHFSFFPGTYVVRIFGHDDPIYVLYDLTLETSAPCREDEYEDNDFFDEAQPITPGSNPDLRGCYLDADFYTFDVEAGQTVTITAMQHEHGGWEHSRLKIYDPSGWVNSQDSDANPSSLQKTMDESGTCTIMVQFWTDLDYDLDITIEG